MNDLNLTRDDEKYISDHGINAEEIKEQLSRFKNGIPSPKLIRNVKQGDGVKRISDGEEKELMELYTKAASEGRLLKFVPASGAASRMFKKLIQCLKDDEQVTLSKLKRNADNGDEISGYVIEFYEHLKKFAFYDELFFLMKKQGEDPEKILSNGEVNKVLVYILYEKGLNYSFKPKGAIKFHKYSDHARTAFEEHFVEAMEYASDKDGTAKLHFTISEEHTDLFKEILDNFDIDQNRNLQVDFSYQKKSTDTIAVTLENEPFRDKKNNILLRPSGHGALLENLNDIKGDIIFVKNIDNVSPDHLKPETYKYKKLLVGLLIRIQNKVFGLLYKIEEGKSEAVTEAVEFLSEVFHQPLPDDVSQKKDEEMKEYLLNRLNRPIRICGVVRTEGHAGGGPFWVKDNESEESLQIVEGAQINKSDPEQKKILENADYFNPVDLVVGVKDYKGNHFDLLKYRDEESGIITQKSYEGRELKALELPGLWNGSMAKWNTMFVEVPAVTFNPVKEVNDLLKPEHQPAK